MILITGAAGFIGSVMACRLNRRRRNDLILCDNFMNTDKWKNVVGLKFVELIAPADLFDFLRTDKKAGKIEAVIHMGACSDTTESDVDYLMDNNVRFSIELCRWAVAQGSRFLYASSGAVYGNGNLGFSDSDELTPKLRPLNAYGFSKWVFDMWVLENGFIDKVAGLRFFNVFGPNEYHKGNMASVVFRAFALAQQEGRVRLFESHNDKYGHGDQERDFIYIDELLDTFFYLFDNKKINGIFNIGTGRTHTFRQLAISLLEALGKPENIEYFPMPEDIRDRYQYHTKADMGKLRSAGYPEQDDRFAEYVKKYVRSYLLSGNKYYVEVT
ncbi:ADP-glyceromanno-heptose 6-epimerase [bacterium]|nr:ADP-glyceromanno-heptose 6-epimerase [bacterium]